MITTFYFLQLLGFQIWYVTSKQVKFVDLPRYVHRIRDNKRNYRMFGGFLILMAIALFIARFGWMTGLCAGIVGLMGAGCLVVSLHPFRYINEKMLVLFYVVFLFLELFV